MSERRVLYLDQNKWIELSRCVAEPQSHQKMHSTLEYLEAGVRQNRLVLPLTFANIYETQKINNPKQRTLLAGVQATLSQGWVIRSRRHMIRTQISDYLSTAFALAVPTRPVEWFLSRFFFDAAAEYSPTIFGFEIPARLLARIRADPARALFSYMTDIPEETRKESVQKYSDSSLESIGRMERRREIWRDQSIAVRKRAYSALLLIEHIDFVFEIAQELGLQVTNITELGRSRAKAIITDVPALNIECNLATKVEYEDRGIDENDLRDVDSFATVMPYADLMVAEKAFVDRARQARLHLFYETRLSTSLADCVVDLDNPLL